MRKLAGSIAIFTPETYDHAISKKGLKVREDVRRHNSQVRKIQHICWNCPSFGALYSNCKFVKDYSKCPKISGWMKQNNIEEL